MPVKHSFQEVRSKGSRILIVEDEALVAADLEEILIDLGYEVCGIADNHDEAVSIAQSLRPNLILMDIHLAGQKDGVAAATAIRLSVGSPVVFLTAHADDDTLARISVAEPFGYTLKPFDERELKATIEVALCRYEAESRSKKMEKW
jgi:DNA-binding response OmpR family regulator